MGRLLILLSVLVLALGAAPAFAQDPTPDFTPTPEELAGDGQPSDDADAAPDDRDNADSGDNANNGDDVLDPDEVPPESTPDPTDDENCVPGPGADGDYVYCNT